MSLADLSSSDAVLLAVAECDRLGRERFLRQHGFGQAREYFLVIDGRLYDSKAIAGVAHGYQFPGRGPLASDELRGGEMRVRRKLESLGFQVRRVPVGQRNPAWERDELILALDLYLRHGPLGGGDQRVVELSALLNQLPLHPLRPDALRFRNPNAVALKLANFAALDPAYPGVGMTRGGRGDRDVWDALSQNPPEVEGLAAAIRAEARAQAHSPLPPEEGEEEAAEGRLLYRRHVVRERNRTLVAKKKARVLRETGRLACQVCEFDFRKTYGDWGEGFIECHHVSPLATAGEEVRTRLVDLAVVCSNCHRVLHRGSAPPSIAQLRDRVFS